MSVYRIGLMPGDGIGPDVVAEAVRVLQALEATSDLLFDFTGFSVGAGEYLRGGDPLPEATFEAAGSCHAILLGAMGLPDVRLATGVEIAPQLDLRERWELYAGLRPLRLYHEAHTPLKGYGTGGIDILLVRENTEGLFWSRKGSVAPGAEAAEDILHISRKGAERVCRAAFEQARRRRRKVTLVDKANVLPSMAFFRAIFFEIAPAYPDVETEAVYVDAMALYLVRNPERFDVVVTENMFGDILSDLGAALIGGMGMAPSGDVGETHAVFQPSHGSAPDIAGKGIANPVATILSAAMMLDWLGAPEARRIHDAVERVLADPANRTPDLGGTLSTEEMGERIAAALS
ncbi:MAG: isocitrate/isopropylmalate dehydrogenase family protein [Bryobacterales bacterium]|nr:isocitrate/isopropylmalate dehydrogenase family protein [Bryobacterales bacterium]